MRIKSIGRYNIFIGEDFKQIYDRKLPRMLQISKDKISYVDTDKMKVIQNAKKVLKTEKPKPHFNGQPKPEPKPSVRPRFEFVHKGKKLDKFM